MTAHPDPWARQAMIGIFAVLVSFPFILALIGPGSNPPTASPYSPRQIQRTALMLGPEELMMSDIPWAVAWYGRRPCLWPTLDDGATFAQANQLKPVAAIYLTQQTTDRHFLTQMLDNKQGWERFMLDSLPPIWAVGETPAGFGAKYGLTNECLDYLAAQMFISNSNRWRLEKSP